MRNMCVHWFDTSAKLRLPGRLKKCKAGLEGLLEVASAVAE